MFGWCQDSHHSQCIERYQRFYFGTKRVNRKAVETIVWLDEWRECDCKCHGKKPVKKQTRRRKK